MKQSCLVLLSVLLSNVATPHTPQHSIGTTARLRAVSTVDARVAWVSGTNGVYARTTDGGRTWQSSTVPGAESLDFRDVEAFGAETAYLLSIGPGENSKIYKTTDGGTHWTLQFTNRDPKAFFDAMAFWDATSGIAMSDPVDGRFALIRTTDGGSTWKDLPRENLPAALAGEAAFAASGTCIAVEGTNNVWLATGGGAARVFRSTDRGNTWTAANTPILSAGASSGIFSVAFRDAMNGVIVGGDYKKESEARDNVARTTDGGRTWRLSNRIGGYRSSVAYVPGRPGVLVAVGPSGSDASIDDGATWTRLGAEGFHAVSFARDVKAGWAAGENGQVASYADIARESKVLAEPSPPGDLDAGLSEMRSLIERYAADRGSLNRFYTVETSSVRRSRMSQFYNEWLGSLDKLDFDAMGQEGRIDYLLFRNHLQHELRQLEIRAKSLSDTGGLIPFAPPISDLEDKRRRMEKVDPAGAAALLTALNRQVEEVRKAVEAGLKTEGKAEGIKPKKTVANRAVLMINGLRNALKNWFGFHNGYDPVFTWWAEAPYKTLDQSLQNYAAFLREKVVGVKPGDDTAIVGDPIGREALMSELAHELIPYTPEELIAIANKEYEWCEAEMKKASRELGYGDDWKKALEHVKTLYVEPGKQPELIRELALEAIAFMDQHDLVTIPQLARDTWRMEMMTPERQLVSPFFLGGETIQVSYPTNTMGHEQKMMSMRGNNVHFSRATVFHELIPGHHLQGFMASRYRAYRSIFGTPFWTEGWALYWELVLWDMSFAKSAENKIGMLFWRMHRCARIIFSLSFHLEKMTPQECIDLLVDRVGHERDNATAEVRRSFGGDYGPLYQCAYLLGGLQLRALRQELVGSGKMTNRAFHDAVLKQNRIPIEMLRASLTQQKLTRDFASSWKFYGLNPAGR